MERLAKIWAPIVSALLLLLAFPPFNLGLLVFAGLAPWIASLDGKSGKEGWTSGYIFGLVFMGGQFVWLAQFVGKWTQSPVLGVIPAILCTLAGALYFAGTGALIALCWRKKWLWGIPVVWTGIEVFRSFIPWLAFPWGLLHTPLWPMPQLIQLANVGSAYLVTLMVATGNLLLALILQKKKGLELRPYGGALLVMIIGSMVKYGAPLEGKGMKVAIGQPAVDLAFGDPMTTEARLKERILLLGAAAVGQGAQLLVLPEGLVDHVERLPEDIPFELPQIPTVLGGSRGIEPTYQSAFAHDGEWTYADKRRLVIFGEFVPGRGILPFLDNFNLPSGDLTPSSKTSALKAAGITIGPMLCFEGLFYDVGFHQAQNGAQLLTIMSIDDWYMGTNAPDQLMAGAVFRAVENGTPAVRSASLGYSFAVDQRGNIRQSIPLSQPTSATVELIIPERPGHFPAAPAVPILAFLFCVFLIGESVWIGISGRRSAQLS